MCAIKLLENEHKLIISTYTKYEDHVRSYLQICKNFNERVYCLKFLMYMSKRYH